ncbi:hypothetical protein SAMN00790413_05886 [Deinococcus hopiensis KR-140]|uniref:Uncharacterized protein n=1 Tax=Deinococcus hopiensis KR-140 TaxID=695939 RepID=A0A1W1UE09_9DEIO|nr:hypothetical protein SAMN00790413_05886 [Deinococcus hopiensis KR-140]
MKHGRTSALMLTFALAAPAGQAQPPPRPSMPSPWKAL